MRENQISQFPLLLDLLEQEPREVVKRSAGDLDNQLLDSIVEYSLVLCSIVYV